MGSFTPAKRLHYPWEYRRFFSNAQVIRLSQCTVFRIPNDRGHFRLGITVKARTNSVKRNRVKRQVREWFRQNESILGSYDYNVVIPSNRKVDHPYPLRLADCLRRELPHALRDK